MVWQVSGNIRGPQGPQGPVGPAGADGAGIEIAGSAPTYAALPTGLGPADAGDGYLVEADGKLYIWNGTAWPADGAGVEFRGPQGPAGADGAQGATGAQGIKGDTGAAGAKGDKGDKGDPGDTGATGATGAAGAAGADGARGTRWFTGSGAPGTIAGSVAGDLYMDTADGTVYTLA